MNLIKGVKIIVNEVVYILEPDEVEFIIRIVGTHQFKPVICEKTDLISFFEKFKQEFIIFLKEAYHGYNQRERNKHPTRFEKFIFEEKKYIVNYTTSPIQRLMYKLYLRLSLLEKSIKTDLPTKIRFE